VCYAYIPPSTNEAIAEALQLAREALLRHADEFILRPCVGVNILEKTLPRISDSSLKVGAFTFVKSVSMLDNADARRGNHSFPTSAAASDIFYAR